ncbi:MAG: SpoIIE family protein phosphatase [Treponema sp.]|nr:SpoIIE family protein phosphatase [Candidatus Treponema equifaecale]
MKKYLKYFLITVLCCAIFFFLGEPFRNFLKLSETTEVRPTSAFPLVFGIAFGIWGTLGCAIGNLIADISSGYPPIVFIPGFFIQILYGYLPALLYRYLRRHDNNKLQLDRVYKIIQFLLLSLVDSLFCAFMIWGLTHLIFGSPVFGLGFWNTFFNQMIFFIVIGIPFMCFVSVKKQNRENRILKDKTYIFFSINEKMILFFLGFSIIISVMASVAGYYIFYPKYGSDPITLWSYVYFVCGSALFLCLCPSLIFLHYVEKNVSTPLERLSTTAKNFGRESDIHLEIEKILMKCSKYLMFSTEIGDLSRSYSIMATELGEYVDNLSAATAEKEKNATQLKIATEIQLGALPAPLVFADLDLYATMKPALEVGGDFYDFFMIDDRHLAVVVADVSGKGVPAALFMMVSKIILKKNLKMGLSPAEALTTTNQELCEKNPAEMFVTCFCGVLDLDSKLFTYANAGHEKPAIARNGGVFELEKINSGFVLGGMDGIKYKQGEIQLEKGDIMFNYTDGIPEAMSPRNEEFGNDRLLQTLNASRDKTLSEIAEDMFKAIETFNDTAPQFDDITMLMFKIK